MSNLTDFIGSGGLNPLTIQSEILTTSQTWVAPKAGKYIVISSGGGGGGANAEAATTGKAGGGAGGFIDLTIVDLALSENVSVGIGSGGIGKSDGTAGNGGDGGTTTFGAYATSLGGQGGKYRANSETVPSAVGGSRGGHCTFESGVSSSYINGGDIQLNLLNLLFINTIGGSTYKFTNGTVYCGGGAGISGDGGYFTAENTSVNPTGKGAGGAGHPYAAGQNGTDGVVYIFWEA